MKTSNSRTTALVLAIGALLAGCAGHPRGTATNTYAVDPAGKQDEFIGDRELAGRFVLLGIKTEPSDGARPMRIQFDLKNTTPGDLAIEWALEWKDASGFRVDTNPHWRPVMVAGQNFHTIQATAPTPEATAFQLHLRRPTAIR